MLFKIENSQNMYVIKFDAIEPENNDANTNGALALEPGF